ncbi:hypothetical protein LLG46_12345 [bacterium]|nr:hypothetical protein [bacterium]
MEMKKKQITLPDGRTLIYFSFPKKETKLTTHNREGEAPVEPKCCCGGEK